MLHLINGVRVPANHQCKAMEIRQQSFSTAKGVFEMQCDFTEILQDKYFFPTKYILNSSYEEGATLPNTICQKKLVAVTRIFNA